MAHKHSVYDTDNHFSIDPITRAIKNESPNKILIMQGDHNSERFTFEIKRYVEGHDMSLCDKIRVHYININAQNKEEKSTGPYEVDDMQICPEDEDIVIFSWLISGKAAMYSGPLAFLIEFSCRTGATIDYEWNTARHTGISVGEGMDNGDSVIERYTDVLELWYTELNKKATANEQSIAQFQQNVDNVNAYLSEMDAKYGNIVQFGDYIDEKGELILTKTTEEKTLANSHAGGIKITPYGNTEQDGTTGAQLIEPKLESGENFGVTITKNADGSYTLNGTATANASFRLDQSTIAGDDNLKDYSGTYTVSLDGNTNENVKLVLMQNGTWAGILATNATATATIEITDCFVYVGVVSGTTLNNYVIKPMLNAGTEAKPWEKFTGGQASPNPDYPCEIKSVKGKNLLDCRGLVEQTINGVKFTPVYDEHGNLLYIEANGTPTATAEYRLSDTVLKFDTAEEYILTDGVTTNTDYYYTQLYSAEASSLPNSISGKFTPENVMYLARILVKTAVSNVRFYPMIRKATIADDTYVPYGLLRFKAHGSNLAKLPDLDSVENVGITWSCKNGVVTAKGTSISTSSSGGFGLHYDLPIVAGDYYVSGSSDGVFVYVSVSKTDGSTEYIRDESFSLVGTETRCRVYLQIGSGKTVDATLYPMLNVGKERKPWKPYTENSITLSEPIELNGIGEVRDGIVEKDGVYGVERKCGRVDLGTLRWTEIVYSNGIISWRSASLTDIKNAPNNTTLIPCFAEKYRQRIGKNMSINGVYGELSIDVNDIATLDAETPSGLFVYLLANPVFESLPTADQIALRSLMSYDGVTYVSCDSEVETLIVTKYGTSEVGAMTIEAHNKAEKNEIRVAELTAAMLMLNQE